MKTNKRSLFQKYSNHSFVNRIHKKYGSSDHFPIYGSGCIDSPKLTLVFMNPTGRNLTALRSWAGPRFPWIGLKQTWKLFYKIGIISEDLFNQTQKFKANEWTPDFAEELYKEVASSGFYTTNLAKCTQADARPLPDAVFIDSRKGFLKELESIKAKHIVTFGNQVSSILLNKKVSVSQYKKGEYEKLIVGKKFYYVYPCFYPIGRGWMNVDKVIKRLNFIKQGL